MTGTELDSATERASELARKLATTTERERALPQALLKELCATGLMRAGVPITRGALEAPPATTLRSSAEVARSMYDLGGGSAIYEDSPLQRRFRDAHTATAHFQVNPAIWELTGRVLLGVPTRTEQL